jgi:hypothetical protein
MTPRFDDLEINKKINVERNDKDIIHNENSNIKNQKLKENLITSKKIKENSISNN